MQDALSPGTLVYFVILIIFGSFFLVNLALAVLYLQFTKEFSVTPSASRSLSMKSGTASRRQQQLLPEDSNFQLDQPQPGQRVTADDYDDDDDVAPGMQAYAISAPSSPPGTSRPISQVGFVLEEPAEKPPPLHLQGKVAVADMRSNSINNAADAQGMLAGEDDGFVTAQVVLARDPVVAAGEQDKVPQTARSIMKQETRMRSPISSLGDSDAQRQQWRTCSSAWAAVRQCCKLVVQVSLQCD